MPQRDRCEQQTAHQWNWSSRPKRSQRASLAQTQQNNPISAQRPRPAFARFYFERLFTSNWVHYLGAQRPAAGRKANPMKTHNFTKTVLTVAGLLALGTFAPHAFAQSGQEQAAPPTATQPGTEPRPGMRGH